MKGRKRKPLHLHLVEGTVRSRTNKREPRAVGNLNEPPADLTEAERAIWIDLIDRAPQGVLTGTDEQVFRLLVDAVHTRNRVKQFIDGKQLVIPTTSGNWIQSPYLSIANKQAAMILKIAAELGYTPVSRARIVSGDVEETDPIAQRFFTS